MPSSDSTILEAISILHLLISRIYKKSISNKKLKSNDILRITKYFDCAKTFENRKRDYTNCIEEERMFVELFDKNYDNTEDWDNIMRRTILDYEDLMKRRVDKGVSDINERGDGDGNGNGEEKRMVKVGRKFNRMKKAKSVVKLEGENKESEEEEDGDGEEELNKDICGGGKRRKMEDEGTKAEENNTNDENGSFV